MFRVLMQIKLVRQLTKVKLVILFILLQNKQRVSRQCGLAAEIRAKKTTAIFLDDWSGNKHGAFFVSVCAFTKNENDKLRIRFGTTV